MQPLSMWENIFLGALAVFVLFWLIPSIKVSMENSGNVEKDWRAVILPIACVVLLVIFLIMMT